MHQRGVRVHKPEAFTAGHIGGRAGHQNAGMHRRALLTLPALLPTLAAAASPGTRPELIALEERVQGRLGFYALDTGTGRSWAHRADERFAMASTFKLLLAARVAEGVDRGRWRWDETVPLQAADRVPHAPAFDRLLPHGRATLAALVQGILVESDNPCANLLLRRCCETPAGLTAWLRAQGDDVTRLDRWETELNENLPGDPRDTSTPRAFARSLQHLLLGPGLTRAGQARLWADMQASTTGLARLRAGVPAGWRVLEKTGTGSRGAVNDVGLVMPSGGRAPWVVVALQSGSAAGTEALSGVIAEALARLVSGWAR